MPPTWFSSMARGLAQASMTGCANAATARSLWHISARAEDGRKYANKRAEMWGRLADWLADTGGADIPQDDALHAQLCAPGYSFDSSSRLLLEPKEKIRERLGASPDAAGALALTFAETVRRPADMPRLGPAAESDYDVFSA